ncbi:MAG: VanW family protein [Oscillospiraceae bacterium]|nr:VanW family protein [Oscillospiraceae bacterium]
MMKDFLPEPKKRSPLRLWAGKQYYTLKRYRLWLFGGLRFARQSPQPLAYTVFTHATPLLRKLKDVEMILQYNKIVNLKIAVKKLDGITLAPGETFSYWKAIGRPAKRKGYLKGMVLRNGGFYAATGGGLCQLSNLIFWMTAHTPLTVTERHRHGYDVFPDASRTQPFGSGATCFYNYGDLMIRNDTQQTFRLHIEVGEKNLTGTWQSDAPPEVTYRVYEREHIMKPEWWGGYTRHNVLFRKQFDAGGIETADEYLIENHAVMSYAPLLESSGLVR